MTGTVTVASSMGQDDTPGGGPPSASTTGLNSLSARASVHLNAPGPRYRLASLPATMVVSRGPATRVFVKIHLRELASGPRKITPRPTRISTLLLDPDDE